jgi:general stress protein 26
MKPNETSKDSADSNVRKLGELIKDVKVAMLTTVGEDGAMHACPMMTQEVAFDGSLWFFTRKSSAKIHNIERDPGVNLVYANPDDQRYVSVAGRAELVEDQAKIDELWSPAYEMWFQGGKENPEVSLIRVEVESAEYWDAPSSAVVYLAGFAKSLITGKKPSKVGEHQKLEIH